MYKLLLGFLLLFPLQIQALTAADSGLETAGQGTGLATNLGIAGYVSLIIRGTFLSRLINFS